MNRHRHRPGVVEQVGVRAGMRVHLVQLYNRHSGTNVLWTMSPAEGSA